MTQPTAASEEGLQLSGKSFSSVDALVNETTSPVIQAEYYRLQVLDITRQNEELKEHLDLQVDEFTRIKAMLMDSAWSRTFEGENLALEIQTICDRALIVTKQRVPLIEQRDSLQSKLDAAERYGREEKEKGLAARDRAILAESQQDAATDELKRMQEEKYHE